MARLFTPSESKYYLMALDAGTGRSWFYGI